eukprot:Gb_05452 [translate_table: standard]
MGGSSTEDLDAKHYDISPKIAIEMVMDEYNKKFPFAEEKASCFHVCVQRIMKDINGETFWVEEKDEQEYISWISAWLGQFFDYLATNPLYQGEGFKAKRYIIEQTVLRWFEQRTLIGPHPPDVRSLREVFVEKRITGSYMRGAQTCIESFMELSTDVKILRRIANQLGKREVKARSKRAIPIILILAGVFDKGYDEIKDQMNPKEENNPENAKQIVKGNILLMFLKKLDDEMPPGMVQAFIGYFTWGKDVKELHQYVESRIRISNGTNLFKRSNSVFENVSGKRLRVSGTLIKLSGVSLEMIVLNRIFDGNIISIPTAGLGPSYISSS